MLAGEHQMREEVQRELFESIINILAKWGVKVEDRGDLAEEVFEKFDRKVKDGMIEVYNDVVIHLSTAVLETIGAEEIE